MTVPSYRAVEAFTGRKSPIPAILAAADEISGQAAELERLRDENTELLCRCDELAAEVLELRQKLAENGVTTP